MYHMDVSVAFLLCRVMESDPTCELHKLFHGYHRSVFVNDLVHLYLVCIGSWCRWVLVIALVACTQVAPIFEGGPATSGGVRNRCLWGDCTPSKVWAVIR